MRKVLNRRHEIGVVPRFAEHRRGAKRSRALTTIPPRKIEYRNDRRATPRQLSAERGQISGLALVQLSTVPDPGRHTVNHDSRSLRPLPNRGVPGSTQHVGERGGGLSDRRAHYD